MTNVVYFSCDILKGINKGGTLKRDAEGWFLNIVLGSLDCENSRGDLYPLASAAKFFSSSSSLMRRAEKGVLFGEAGHPEFKRGMSSDEFINRLKQFPHNNISHSIRNLRLMECINPQTNEKYTAILGDVLPIREKGAYLEKELLTRDINVCFSIRTLTNDIPRSNFTYVKHITEFLTIDWVNEGGIHHAQKYNSPTLEHFKERREAANESFCFSKEQMEIAQSKAVGYGMEDNNGLDISGAFNSDLKLSNTSLNLIPASKW